MPTTSHTVDPTTEKTSGIDPIISVREFMRITDLSRATVYRMFALGLLERPVRISQRRVGLRLSTTQSFLDSRPTARGEK
jgi:predicted DNA-binding transcriptional regulator AlpA